MSSVFLKNALERKMFMCKLNLDGGCCKQKYNRAHQILIIASMDIMLNMKHTAVTFAKSHHNIGETNFRVKITLDCP